LSNGNAHLKNFSLLESKSGDYVMSPAYDLVNTRIHIDDTDFALSKKFIRAVGNGVCLETSESSERSRLQNFDIRRFQIGLS
jgi:serine/threonine-protein kinase HipA